MTQPKGKSILLIDFADESRALAVQALEVNGFSVDVAGTLGAVERIEASKIPTYDLIVVAYDHGANNDGNNTMAELRLLVGDSLPNGLEIVCYSTEKHLDRDDLESIGDNSEIFAHLPDSNFSHLVEVIKQYLGIREKHKSHLDE